MSMFIDLVTIYIKSGNGGNGAVSFRREKYVPLGGPDGGDGGKGGDVIFKVDKDMTTLIDFRYKGKYAAEHGGHGQGSKCYGKDGKDIIIKVPMGTVIKEKESGKIIADLNKMDSEVKVLRGGKGGKGNVKFATATRQAPDFAEPGMPGEELTVTLELKLLADVGLVGFPNVGKSTLLSMVSSARPKIADYHFTTLSPNLGVVSLKGINSFVIADIPGIIEGASEGVGLGLKFLRHIERTRVLIHVVDISESEGRNALEDFKKINEELKNYSIKLWDRPQIIACNKSDMLLDDEFYENFKKEVSKLGYDKVFKISAATNQGLEELMKSAAQTLSEHPIIHELYNDEDMYIPELKRFTYEINVDEEGRYVIEGSFVERLLDSTNINNPDHLRYFHKVLKNKGVMDDLIKMGIQDGDTVKLRDFEFEYMG